MNKKTKNKPTLAIGKLFNELVGHTTELKISFREKYDVSKYMLDDYCNGRKKKIEAHHIEFFLNFFNEHKHPARNSFELKDLYELPIKSRVSKDLKLSK